MSKKLDHKIVCWGDYAIPCPVYVKWRAFDASGELYFYKNKPYVLDGMSIWSAFNMYDAALYKAAEGCSNIVTPEPGKWDTQLYWIG